jgi:superfamily II DNA helicase RecQ
VSHRWHKFLQVDEASLKGSRAPAAPATKRTQAGAGIAEPQRPTRPKVLQLKKEEGGSGGGDDCILRALRAVLRNDDAQFRSPQQELAVRAAAAKDTPLVAVLPTGGGKSLVFMVPAMLTGAGVTIVVAPYAELKRQLVTRCLDAGLECKHWPEARESWPRVVIVSAEAASSDDFLQWAADLRVRDRLDRVVIDECHLMFTAANEYRRKLRALVLLRNLGCAFVFLTGTLPPLCQREFEEAMQLQNPLYIRASSHRTNVEYLVQRVGNGRGVTEVIRRAKARLGLTAKGGGGKGIVYCATHAKCQMLALQLKCHYYHGTPDDADAHFLAQREEGFQAWLRGESPYIVATSALGTGIDVPGITHVIHFGAPYSIIDYAQEAGRAGRAGERVEAVIVVEERDWPTEDPKREATLELKTREVNALIRTSGCRRSVLGRCLDNDLRDCDRIDAVPCDNCQREKLQWKSELSSQGQIMSEAFVKKVSRGMQLLQSALETVAELQSMACVICWMFEGSGAANHKWGVCNELDDGLSFSKCMEFQRGINYRRDPQAAFLSCYFCHVSQQICTEGYQTRGESCRRKHVVIPVAYAASTDDELWGMVQELAGRKISNGEDYCAWLGRKHGKLVCGQEMTNAMAVFNLVVEWREGRKIQ